MRYRPLGDTEMRVSGHRLTRWCSGPMAISTTGSASRSCMPPWTRVWTPLTPPTCTRGAGCGPAEMGRDGDARHANIGLRRSPGMR